MAKAEHKNLSLADETRRFELGKLELINIGGGAVGRLITPSVGFHNAPKIINGPSSFRAGPEPEAVCLIMF